MLPLAIFLLLLGTAFLIVEVFIPGFGFFGVTGIVLVVVSAIITIIAVPFGVFIVLAEVAVIGIVIFGFIEYVRRKQLYGKIILTETLNMEEKEIGDLEYFMGKEGVSKTSLRPFGSADFNGVTLEVCSDGAYISEGRKIKVVDVNKDKILVKELGSNK